MEDPILFELILSAVVSLTLGIITILLNRFVGIKIEEKHRQVLHSALQSGIMAAINHSRSGTQDIHSADDLLDFAIEYARRSSGDAIDHFRNNPELRGVLYDIARSKLEDIRRTDNGTKLLSTAGISAPRSTAKDPHYPGSGSIRPRDDGTTSYYTRDTNAHGRDADDERYSGPSGFPYGHESA